MRKGKRSSRRQFRPGGFREILLSSREKIPGFKDAPRGRLVGYKKLRRTSPAWAATSWAKLWAIYPPPSRDELGRALDRGAKYGVLRMG
jgi:hypothetical protein